MKMPPLPPARPHYPDRPAVVLVVFLLACHLASAPVFGVSSDISKKLDGIVEALGTGYRAKKPSVVKESVAIFSFSSSEKLAKRNVGFAVGELLTHKFIKAEQFVVVERAALNGILEEQKLQQTEAIDPRTAVEVGKLLGAHLLLLGSVEMLGGSYQLNARLVEVKTGEVLATAYQELEARHLEEEARPYLARVPETQAIGLYLLYSYRLNSNDRPESTYVADNAATETMTPRQFKSEFVGAGVRYFALRRVFADLSGMLLIDKQNVGTIVGAYSSLPSSTYRYDYKMMQGSIIRVLVGYGGEFAGRFHWHAAAGLSRYELSAGRHDFDSGGDLKAVAPSLRIGVEARPQSRFSMGLSVGYDWARLDGLMSGNRTISGYGLNRLSLEPNLSIHF